MNRPGRTAGLQAAAVHYVLLMNLRRFAKSYQVPDLRVENRNGFAPYFRYTAALHHLYCFGGWGIFLFERVTYLIEEHANSVPEVWKRSNNQLQKGQQANTYTHLSLFSRHVCPPSDDFEFPNPKLLDLLHNLDCVELSGHVAKNSSFLPNKIKSYDDIILF
jgi:hypothetical protein